MRTRYLSGLISAVFGMTAATAGAQTIEIGFGPGPNPIVGVGCTGLASSGPVNCLGPGFTASATDFSSGADLGSTATTVSVQSTGELMIWVTETDINLGPTPQKLSFLSSLTQNALPALATVTETTWFDASNTPFGTGMMLATATFNTANTNNPGIVTIVNALTPYSITEEYDVTIPIPSQPSALSTISLQTTTDGPIPIVPEPSSWAMMAIGFAGLAYAAYGRNRKSRVKTIG
jgi:hypothetical protein